MQQMEPIGTIVYIAYGRTIYHYGALFSFLTAYHLQRKETSHVRYVIYTDSPSIFEGYDIHIEIITNEFIDRMMEGSDYVHRLKPQVLRHALNTFGDSVVLVDTDTYFRKAPSYLFKRLAPGICCLHVLEGQLQQTGTELNAQLMNLIAQNQFRYRDGQIVAYSRSSPMWNSGVMGLHLSDAAMLDEMLHQIDQLWAAGRISLTEQFVAGSVLSQNLKVRSCRDIVFHYWEFTFRSQFESKLPSICRDLMAIPVDRRSGEAYKHRPHPTWRKRITNRMRIVLRKLGADVKGAVRSV